jgi:hypothetical protein
VQAWLEEATLTFILVYAFTAPVGAILTASLLTHDTHRIPRLLGLFAFVAVGLGMLSAVWW